MLTWNGHDKGRAARKLAVHVAEESDSERADGGGDVGTVLERLAGEVVRDEACARERRSATRSRGPTGCGRTSTADQDHDRSLLAEERLPVANRQRQQEHRDRQEVCAHEYCQQTMLGL